MWQQNYTEWATACRYNVTLESGKFEVIKDSIAHLADDRRLPVLLIALAFGAFIEAAVGFATPSPSPQLCSRAWALRSYMPPPFAFSPTPRRFRSFTLKHSLILTFGRRRAASITPFWAP
jgi:L-lactate permease